METKFEIYSQISKILKKKKTNKYVDDYDFVENAEVWKSEGASESCSIRSIEERPPLIFNPSVPNTTSILSPSSFNLLENRCFSPSPSAPSELWNVVFQYPTIFQSQCNQPGIWVIKELCQHWWSIYVKLKAFRLFPLFSLSFRNSVHK